MQIPFPLHTVEHGGQEPSSAGHIRHGENLAIVVEHLDAVLFDMDGVITDTAKAHAAAWQRLFDEYLRRQTPTRGQNLKAFDLEQDYRDYLDGKPRPEGVRDFLLARGINLPFGHPDDPPDQESIHGLGNRKNQYFHQWLARHPASAFADTLALIDTLRHAGIKTAAFSASRNCREVLSSAGVIQMFDVIVDGNDLAALNLPGKPHPAMLYQCARQLQVNPERAAVVDDSRTGVQAAVRGQFGLVIGIDRENGPRRTVLYTEGADWVVSDLAELRLTHADSVPHRVAPEPEFPPPGHPTATSIRADGRTGPEPASTDWVLVHEHYLPAQEGLRETLCTLGNGCFATRGAAPETATDAIHYPGTYLAGGYDRLRTEISGHTVENEDLVNLPNWLPLSLCIEDGPWFHPDQVEWLDYRQELDLYQGLLLRTLRFRDANGRVTRWSERRLVSMAHPHLAGLTVEVQAENWSGRLSLRAMLDGGVRNAGVARYRSLNGQHLEILGLEQVADDTILLHSRTRQSRLEVVQAARTQLYRDGQLETPERRLERDSQRIGQVLSLELAPGASVTVEKIVALYSNRDSAISEPGLAARQTVASAGRFDVLLAAHRLAWRHLWEQFDIQIETTEDTRANLKLRLHIFHLLQTVSRHSLDHDIGVPARGWHGEAYRGHIFWDELFIFPLLNLRLPALTRGLLRYRYRRLPAARQAARTEGFFGAMYPWQSGSDGREESQQRLLNPDSGRWLPDDSRLQRHINAAIAYNLWHYHEVTGDHEFLLDHGAEILLEIARFWASLARYDPTLDRYEILGVMGPDEYHSADPGADPGHIGLDNNAYTNVMAAWALSRAGDVLDLLSEAHRRCLCERLELGEEEIERWDEISRKLRLVFHADGILSQFEGYEGLREFDWPAYRRKYGSIRRLDRILEAENDTPNRYKASKQADVLMLFYLFSADELSLIFERLGYSFDPALIPRTIDYYLARTSHGSTLSWMVHAWVLARASRPEAWSLFTQALDSDIADTQGNTTPEGIHLGAMAGTVDLVQRCFTGIETRAGILYFNPCLPVQLRALTVRIHYRGHDLTVRITHDELEVGSRQSSAAPITIGYRGRFRGMAAGGRYRFRLSTRTEHSIEPA